MSSPFQKKKVEFRREPTKLESVCDFITSRCNSLFMDYLPSEDIKAMSPEYLYPIGIFTLLALVGIFLAIFLTGFYDSIKNAYLSPISGTVADTNCVTIPAVNTGTYLATQQGQWQGANGFQFGNASYQLLLTSTSFSYQEYDELMMRVYFGLQFIKNISVNYDLASNLMYWMSVAFVSYPGNTAQRFVFVGTPLVVLNRQKIIGTVSSVQGDCNASSVASFDSANGILNLVYNYDEYSNNPVCNNTLPPALLDYLPNADGNRFTIPIDSRSIVTAMAINMGILQVDNLVELSDLNNDYIYDGVNYTVKVYYDSKYNGMAPISCINFNVSYAKVSNYTFCSVQLNQNIYGVPLFNHQGSSASMPAPCNCSDLSDADLRNSYNPCNVFSFLTGVLFFPTESPDDVMQMWINIGVVRSNSVLMSPVSALAYDAMFVGSYWGKNSPNRTLLDSAFYRQQIYEFCKLPDGSKSCSLLTFSVFDRKPQNWAVSDYYFQVQFGACQNTFVPPYDEWRLLIEQPYAPLTQDYQKCHYDTSTVLFNQAGSSVGNVSLLAPLCIAFILICISCAQIKKTYTDTEKAEALSDLALKLLLTRDKKEYASAADGGVSVNDHTVLAKLVSELGEEPADDHLYRQESTADGPSVTWGSVKAAVGLNKRAPRDSSAQSLQLEEEGRRNGSGASADASTAEPGFELRPVASPLHHFKDVADAVLAMRAGKNKFVVLNDYEVTPALLKLCGINGIATEGTHGQQLPQAEFSVPALFAILDALIGAFEAAGQDKSRSLWTQVSQTAILRVVPLASLSRADSHTLYLKLNTLLALHATVVFVVSLEEVKRSHAATVAYLVGPEPLTLEEIRIRL